MLRQLTRNLLIAGFYLTSMLFASEGVGDYPVEQLKNEIKHKGWIVYGARTEESNGTYDLYLCRPDGSANRNITNTSEFEEAAPLFSRDSKKLLYRRFKKGAEIHHDRWGFQGQLVIANADGSNPEVIGEEAEYPWACWSADGTQIACLNLKGIQFYDLETKKMVRQHPRKGIYQQLCWSPDGQWFCGVANAAVKWTIVRMDANSGELNVAHEFQSCTPNWFPDSEHIIFSSRPAGQPTRNGYGWTQLWMVDGDGTNPKLVFGEDGFHIYGGALSPDGKYVLFTKSKADGGASEKSGSPIFVMRLEDAPLIKGESEDLRKIHPDTSDGSVLALGIKGWEPEWTYAEIVE